VLKVALAAKVDRVLYNSSDKAVNPTNVMGTSKLLAEKVVTAASIQCTNGCRRHIFSCSRFGNVLGSNGSVIPIFKEQIKHGGPVTVTDREMSRFVMTIDEAARLVIKGAAMAKGGEVFVTKMPVVRIVDLAEAMIEVLAPTYGYRPDDIDIDYIGARPGEKLYEELMSEEETARALELEEMFSIIPALKERVPNISFDYPTLVSSRVNDAYISRLQPCMNKDEIIAYLIFNKIMDENETSAYLATLKRPPQALAS
jgi:FlaA1/EpsC-like NDP-sugar epimerase